MIDVYLIDDHPIVRRGIAGVLAAEPGLAVCGQAGDASAALAALAALAAKQVAPAVITLDLSLGEASGLDLIDRLREVAPGAAILVLSMHDELLYAERALRAGAQGYVMKHAPIEVLVEAIRRVAAGELHVSPEVSRHVVRACFGARAPRTGSPLDTLSDRELQILELLGRGLSTRAISEQLHVSVKTIESYRARLKVKMDLRSGAELVRFAILWAADAHRRQTSER